MPNILSPSVGPKRFWTRQNCFGHGSKSKFSYEKSFLFSSKLFGSIEGQGILVYSYQIILGSWVNMKRTICSVCSNFCHIWMKTFFIGTQFHSIMIWGQMTLNWSFVMFDFSEAQFTLVQIFLRFKLQKLSLVRFSCKMQCS